MSFPLSKSCAYCICIFVTPDHENIFEMEFRKAGLRPIKCTRRMEGDGILFLKCWWGLMAIGLIPRLFWFLQMTSFSLLFVGRGSALLYSNSGRKSPRTLALGSWKSDRLTSWPCRWFWLSQFWFSVIYRCHLFAVFTSACCYSCTFNIFPPSNGGSICFHFVKLLHIWHR